MKRGTLKCKGYLAMRQDHSRTNTPVALPGTRNGIYNQVGYGAPRMLSLLPSFQASPQERVTEIMGFVPSGISTETLHRLVIYSTSNGSHWRFASRGVTSSGLEQNESSTPERMDWRRE